MGNNQNPRVKFFCEYCKVESSDRPSHYALKRRHFCSQNCYSLFRKDLLPKEEQNRYGTGYSPEERLRRAKARSTLNHHLRDNHISRPGCVLCGERAEAHHTDYSKPLQVTWLCFKHHRMEHKKINQHPELISKD